MYTIEYINDVGELVCIEVENNEAVVDILDQLKDASILLFSESIDGVERNLQAFERVDI